MNDESQFRFTVVVLALSLLGCCFCLSDCQIRTEREVTKRRFTVSTNGGPLLHSGPWIPPL